MRKPKAFMGLLASIIVCMGLAAPAAHAAGTSRVELPCVKSGEGATGPHAKDFCWIDWSNLPLKDGTTPVTITVDGGRIDADVTLTHSANSLLFVNDYSAHKQVFSKLIPAYKLAGNTAIGFRQKTVSGQQDRDAKVTFSNITAVPDMDAAGMNVLKDFQMAFGDAERMSSRADGSWEQTDITSDKPLHQLGWVGDTDPAHSYGKANTGWDTTHVTLAGGSVYQSNSYQFDSHGALVAGAQEPSTFTVDFQQHRTTDGDSAIAVGIYMPYTTAYPLHYDGNGAQQGVTPQQRQ